MSQSRKLARALDAVQAEYERASEGYRPFNSAHEGLAVIMEEFEELKAQVWLKREERDSNKMMTEAKHLAAMAIRFIVDVTP